MVREIILDTETTGLDPAKGDRIVEVGAVELLNHLPTGRTFHSYTVMSAGTAARESIELIKKAGATAHAIAIALDRQEMATEVQADGSVKDVQHSAVQYVRNTLGMSVCCIAELSDLLAYLSTQTGHQMGQHLPKVQAYRDRYGV